MTTPHACIDVTPSSPAGQAYGLGAAALSFQSMGYAVLGLGVGSKRPHPLFEHGVKWATTDHAMVPWMWGQERMAGVAVATGQASGLIVIDLDVKTSADGPSELAQFMIGDSWGARAYLTSQAFPGAPVVVTPSGGYHIWLRTPPGMAVPSRTGILPSVDLAGDGHYVVAPPSRVWVDSAEGDRVLLPYRWMGPGCPCSPPWAPPWLLQWAATAEGTGNGGSAPGAREGGGGDPVDLATLKQNGLPVGARNVELHRLACSLYRRYGTLPPGLAAARADIDEVLAATHTGGFSKGEITRALHSALLFVRRSEKTDGEGYDQVRQAMS
jgi:hypothetical protein